LDEENDSHEGEQAKRKHQAAKPRPALAAPVEKDKRFAAGGISSDRRMAGFVIQRGLAHGNRAISASKGKIVLSSKIVLPVEFFQSSALPHDLLQ
jgi:hypothetical protein